MNHPEVLNTITETIAAVFDMKHSNISINTTHRDISGWDSLNQIKLTVALEEEFDIEYEPEEISRMNTVETMLEITLRKLNL
jgi:acyl carrier protein